MDCQIVMGAFAYMYYHFVVSPAGLVDSVMATVCRMSPEEVVSCNPAWRTMLCMLPAMMLPIVNWTAVTVVRRMTSP